MQKVISEWGRGWNRSYLTMNPLLAQLVASSDHPATPQWPLLCNDSLKHQESGCVFPAICQKNPKNPRLHGELPQTQQHGCQSTDFPGLGTQQEPGDSLSPCGVTAHHTAGTLLPITTKPLEIPCPQRCDSFRVGKKAETQLVVQGNGRTELSSPKVADGGVRLSINGVWGSWGSHIPMSWHSQAAILLQACVPPPAKISAEPAHPCVTPRTQRMPHTIDETHLC